MLLAVQDDKRVRVWNLDTGEDVSSGRIAIKPDASAYGMAIGAKNDVLAIGFDDGTVEIWDIGTGKVAETVRASSLRVYSVALSRDGTLLVAGMLDGTIRVLRRNIKEPAIVVDADEDFDADGGDPDAAMAFSRDDRYLATSARKDTVCIVDVARGDVLRSISTGQGDVAAIAFDNDGSELVTVGTDRTARWWHVQSGSPCRTDGVTFDKHDAVAIDPSVQGVVSFSYSLDRTPQQWVMVRSSFGSKASVVETPFSAEIEPTTVNQVAVSPNGRFVGASD
jgi:WD40 repeat protein